MACGFDRNLPQLMGSGKPAAPTREWMGLREGPRRAWKNIATARHLDAPLPWFGWNS